MAIRAPDGANKSGDKKIENFCFPMRPIQSSVLSKFWQGKKESK